jgi:hypothetical protein
MSTHDPYRSPEAATAPMRRRRWMPAGLGGWALPLAGGLLLFAAYSLLFAWGRAWWVLNMPDTAPFRGNLMWDLALASIYFSATLLFGATFALMRLGSAYFRPMYVACCIVGMLVFLLIGTQPHAWADLLPPSHASLTAAGVAAGWSAFWIPWLYRSARARSVFST